VKAYFLFVFATAIMISGFSSAYAHTTIKVDPYEIEVGWKDEPPLVTQQNAIIFSITQPEDNNIKSGVTNAFKDLEATVKSGGVSKLLNVNSDIRAGQYYAKIIPTKTGSLTVELKGTINGVPVNEDVTIEDVGSTDILAFPPTGSDGSNQDVLALKNAMTSLQKDVTEIKSKVGNTAAGTNVDLSKSYDFAIFGMALGVAGVVLAIIAMIKRK
jgi:hypothetical protein